MAASAATQKPRLLRGEAGCIYLIDTMSFIFRAYHAMARQRGCPPRPAAHGSDICFRQHAAQVAR